MAEDLSRDLLNTFNERKTTEQEQPRSEGRLSEELNALWTLYALQAKLSRETQLNRAIDEILAAACDLGGTDRSTMQLVREDGIFEIVAERGYAENSPFISYFREGGFEEGCHKACRERKPIIIEDAANFPGLARSEAGAITVGEGVLAAQSTPLISHAGTAIGVLSTQYRCPYRPTDDEMMLINQVAFLAADFIERFRAEKALRESEERFRVTVMNSSIVLAQFDHDLKYIWIHNPHPDFDALQVLGKRDDELENSEAVRLLSDLKRRVVEKAIGVREEITFYRSDGAHTYDMIIEPIYNDAGVAIGGTSCAVDITERKKAEEALHESEKLAVIRARELEEAIRQKADILESISDCFYALDKELRFIYVNKAAEEIWGMSRAELLGRRIEDVFKGLIDISMSKFRQALSEQIPQRYEVFSKVAQKWGDMSVCPTGDGLSVYFRDITERKNAEAALRESEERFRTLFENAEYGFVLIKPLFDNNGQVNDLYYLQINPAFERVTGLSAEDFLGKRLSEALPGVEPRWLYSFSEAFRSGKPMRDEGYNHNTNRWYEQIVFPYPGGLLGEQFIDITERKRLDLQHELLLEISRELVGLTSIPETIDRLGEKIGRYFGVDWAMFAELIESNEYSIASLGWNADDAVSLKGTYRMRDFLSDEQLATNNAGVPTIVSDTQTDARVSAESYGALGIRSFIIIPISRDGLWRFQISIIDKKPRTWRDDEIALLQEITDRIWARLEHARAEEALRESEENAQALVHELEEADKNKNLFLSVLSHELRNPLAVIVAGLSLLDITDDKEMASTTKEIIKSQVGQLTKLVDDLLDLTRINQNKISLKKLVVNLNEILNNVSMDFKPQYTAKEIQMIVKLPTWPVIMNADRVRIAQCVGNLLHNSLKFTEPAGKVTLSLEIENNEAVICVQDSGIGIDSHLLSRIFEPFTQADTSLARSDGGGLGLGLSIVKGIVELHGGSVAAFSEGLGKGALLTIRLPVLAEDTEARNGTTEKKASRACRILLIEDNKEFSDVLCVMLDLMGHQVSAAYTGPDGIHEAKQDRPDVIFCDIGLPGMSGYEVAEILKKDDDLKSTVLIALSGYASEDDVERAKKVGFDRHLAKPVDMAMLEKILADI